MKSLQPALHFLISAYLKLGPDNFYNAREYVSLLSSGFNDDFLKVGSPYFGGTETQLRIAIFCQLHIRDYLGWNDFHILDGAAKNHGAAAFLSILEDELNQWSLMGATASDLDSTRQKLLDSLRDDFDCELRRLLAVEKESRER